MKIKWLRKASKNLDEAASYIALDNLEAAQKFYIHIREKVEALANCPQMGRPGRISGTRELVIDQYPYIVPYRVRGNVVQIIRVFHTSRKLPEKW